MQKQKADMFNLEQSIAEWRRQMTAGGVKTPMPLDEFESHLREDIGNLLSAGMSEDQAFKLAASRIGNPGPLKTEFTKLRRKPFRPVTIGSWLWVGAIIVLTIGLSRGLFAGRLSLLLSAHIFSLTAGYGAAFLAGFFAVYYVCFSAFRSLSSDRQALLEQAVCLFIRLAAGLVLTGFLFAMLWSRQNLGHYLWTGGAREIGCICASVWLIAVLLIQKCSRVSQRAIMLMCVGGNVIVAMAWFGTVIISSHSESHGRQFGIICWSLAIFLAIHLVFLGMG